MQRGFSVLTGVIGILSLLLSIISASKTHGFHYSHASVDEILKCYDQSLGISCENSEQIVIRDARFGFFHQFFLERKLNASCQSGRNSDCWIDVTPAVSRLCSGYHDCTTNVLYSVDFSHEDINHECSIDSEAVSKPSLFVEYTCVSPNLFTRISGTTNADTEQVGGYLTSIDYTEVRLGGAEWRSHLADAMCHPERLQLPSHFYLPAPSIQQRSAFGQEETAAFILRVKDLGLTRSSQRSSAAVVASPGLQRRGIRLASETSCPDAGRPCWHDYLEINAKLPADRFASQSEQSASLLPVAKFCVVEDDTEVENMGELVNEKHWTGLTFGPLPRAVGLEFKSNLNLLDANALTGKGIMIEYIALFCTPIVAPSGSGIVDYQFRQHASSTVAQAVISCPSNRWLQPQQPSGWSMQSWATATKAGDSSGLVDKWWLERRRDITLDCDHHSYVWMPDRIPEACLTEQELASFVAVVNVSLQQALKDLSRVDLPSSNSSAENHSSPPSEASGDQGNANASRMDALIAHAGEQNSGDVNYDGDMNSGTSVVVGAVVGFIICLALVCLIVFTLRRRFIAHYQKKDICPSLPPDRLNRSCHTLNHSVAAFPPGGGSQTAELYRRFNGKKPRWENFFFRPWRAHSSGGSSAAMLWSQNLRGTCPDYPKHTMFTRSGGVMTTTGTATPETMLVDSRDGFLGQPPRAPPTWMRMSANQNGFSSFSLAPSAHPPSCGPVNGSPWLRTNSTTRLMQQSQLSYSTPNQYSATEPSSATELHIPTDGSQYPQAQQQQFRSKWRPWRRSLRRNRRPQEIVFPSQRRLLDSNRVSNSSSMQFQPPPSFPPSSQYQHSPTVPPPTTFVTGLKPQITPANVAASWASLQDRHAYQTNAEGPLLIQTDSPMGTHVVRQAMTPNYAGFNGGGQLFYTNADPSSGYPIPSQGDYVMTDGGTKAILSESVTGGEDQLPWKTTIPAGQSGFRQGFRRFSSFLRTINGSMTPPMGSQRSNPSLEHTRRLQSLTTLSGDQFFFNGDYNGGGQLVTNPMAMRPSSSFHVDRVTNAPRTRSESGSMRLQRTVGPLPHPGVDPMHSFYHADTETPGDHSLSSSATTRTTRIGSTLITSPLAMPGSENYNNNNLPSTNPLEWAYNRPQSPTGLAIRRPHSTRCGHQTMATNRSHLPPIPNSNDPYLIPLTMKCQREKASRLSTSDHMPSGTSSAISSLVFADSVEGERDPLDWLSPPQDPPTPVATSGSTAPGVGPEVLANALRSLGPHASMEPSGGSVSSCRTTTEVPAMPFNLTPVDALMDYMTYDETRSIGGPSVQIGGSNGHQIHPPTGLMATQVDYGSEASNKSGRYHTRPLRREHANKLESRPLSTDMISNHYYAGQDLSTSDMVAGPPRLPPRVNPPLGLAPMMPSGVGQWGRPAYPALPPLWSPSGSGSDTSHTQHHPLSSAQRQDPNGVYGSVDSLYETVDQVRQVKTGDGNLTTRPWSDEVLDESVPGAQSVQDLLSGGQSRLEREKLALPPTPGSLESLRAPVASGDEVDDIVEESEDDNSDAEVEQPRKEVVSPVVDQSEAGDAPIEETSMIGDEQT